MLFVIVFNFEKKFIFSFINRKKFADNNITSLLNDDFSSIPNMVIRFTSSIVQRQTNDIAINRVYHSILVKSTYIYEADLTYSLSIHLSHTY